MQNVITLTNRQTLNILGVTKVSGVSPSEVMLEMEGDRLLITGEGMEVQTLDVENKVLTILGKINSMKFLGAKVPLLKRIFK
ncbi:MAG TPA: YabP/YqfC family sporulation protein [Candidatus Caccopulliclostridium gallistercoris]|uniref:YabP/YqfC family sporulation protein n=1 Tax=Candidatus Caccopulliclostridium gallistercoris TaxID=2840719 RepID=A0A9D1NF11_9FIRM|nr:YabP/YqfC family sporulation protein [Candidatus Caccopulliclostridium gallistercoris]